MSGSASINMSLRPPIQSSSTPEEFQEYYQELFQIFPGGRREGALLLSHTMLAFSAAKLLVCSMGTRDNGQPSKRIG